MMFRYQIPIFMLLVSCQKRIEKALGLEGGNKFQEFLFEIFLFRFGIYLILCHADYTKNILLHNIHYKQTKQSSCKPINPPICF